MLFHFGADWLPGGFTGVDIFFVISGFLISRSIFGDVADGSFSLAAFYERRIRRIAPAFLAVTAVTAAVASLVLLPHEMLIFGRSVLWSVFAMSNVFFFNRVDYFGPGAHEMPLLHYWSLAVEEQFYLIFPALILVLRRYVARAMPWVIVILLVVSLAASEFMLRYDPAAAYFLLPFRAFELLIGTVLALPEMRFPRRPDIRAGAVLAGCGLVMAGMLLITSRSPFPGLLALIPCLGAALVIWGGENGSIWPTRLLSSRPMLFYGAISYSLYLVHWPIVSLTTEWLGHLEPVPFLIGGVVASTLLGYLSYKFVEQPFRRNRAFFSPKMVVSLTLAGTICLAGLAQYTIKTRGLPTRFSPEIRELASYAFYDSDPIFRTGRCFTTFYQTSRVIEPECLPTQRPAVMVWGSSYVAQFIGAIEEAAKSRGYAVGQITGAACPPLVSSDAPGVLPFCTPLNNFALDWIRENRPAILVLGGIEALDPAALGNLDKAIAEISARGTRVVVIGPVPSYTRTVPKLLARRLAGGDRSTLAGADLDPSMPREDHRLIEHFAKTPDVTYISVLRAACPTLDCPLSVDGKLLQFDAAHFTQAGVDFFGRPVSRLIFDSPKTTATPSTAASPSTPAVSSAP